MYFRNFRVTFLRLPCTTQPFNPHRNHRKHSSSTPYPTPTGSHPSHISHQLPCLPTLRIPLFPIHSHSFHPANSVYFRDFRVTFLRLHCAIQHYKPHRNHRKTQHLHLLPHPFGNENPRRHSHRLCCRRSTQPSSETQHPRTSHLQPICSQSPHQVFTVSAPKLSNLRTESSESSHHTPPIRLILRALQRPIIIISYQCDKRFQTNSPIL